MYITATIYNKETEVCKRFEPFLGRDRSKLLVSVKITNRCFFFSFLVVWLGTYESECTIIFFLNSWTAKRTHFNETRRVCNVVEGLSQKLMQLS